MAPLIEFVHVLCGVTFFGITIASFVYIANSIKQKNALLLHYALKISLLSDILIFPMIVIQFLSGTVMVHYHHLSFNTPWIIVAYAIFGMLSLLWFMTVLIKYSHYKSKMVLDFKYKKSFMIINMIIILLFCLIIHDAVTQQTFLWR